MFDSGAYRYSTILLQSQPVATFPEILYENDYATISVGRDFPRILYENDYATISVDSDFPRYHFSNFWNGFSIWFNDDVWL